MISWDVSIPSLASETASNSEKYVNSPNILIPLAPGFEEIEAVTIIDILRRAGAKITIAGQSALSITGSHGITILCDALLSEIHEQSWDWIIIPGGTEGVQHLLTDEKLKTLLQNQHLAEKGIAAICAAPLILHKEKLTKGQAITLHPAVAPQIQYDHIENQAVVKGELLITGRSAGAAMHFAFTLVKEIFGPEKAAEVNQGVIAELPADF